MTSTLEPIELFRANQEAVELDNLVTCVGCYLLAVLLVTPKPEHTRRTTLVYDLNTQESRELNALLVNLYAVINGADSPKLNDRVISCVLVEAAADLSSLSFSVFLMNPDGTQQIHPFFVQMDQGSWYNFYKHVMLRNMVMIDDIQGSAEEALSRVGFMHVMLKLEDPKDAKDVYLVRR